MVAIIGAGITGLSLASFLKQKGIDCVVLEKDNRTGGQILTKKSNGFTYETGPNTGVVSNPSVARLFQILSQDPLIANQEAKCRYILKSNKLHRLPTGLWGGITTPLFTFRDKLYLLGEPFRKKGINPQEDVASLAVRRLGKSFCDYAVTPFVGGIYAGDPTQLVTQYALPKLYNLEQQYGSFVRGSIALSKRKKSGEDKLVTKRMFSSQGGLSSLINSMVSFVGGERVKTSTEVISVESISDGDRRFRVVCTNAVGEREAFQASHVVSTVPSYALSSFLSSLVGDELVQPLTRLHYAPVIEIAVGFDKPITRYHGYGVLTPVVEPCQILGILFVSDFFPDRTPLGHSLYSVFMGGDRMPDMIHKSEEELIAIALDELYRLLQIDSKHRPILVDVRCHSRAIPQYGASYSSHLEAVDQIQSQFPQLIIAGNLRDGVGMAHRIAQSELIANQIAVDLS